MPVEWWWLAFVCGLPVLTLVVIAAEIALRARD